MLIKRNDSVKRILNAVRPPKIRGLKFEELIMSRRLPPLLSLQAFEAAARYENFAAAAKELNLSQSAVSHRVRGLERHIGHPLFERLPRGLRLTEAAKAYLPSIRSAFEDILGATSGVFGQGGGAVLNIRAPISYTALWLTGLVDEFQQSFPHVEIRLTSSIWVDKTANGEADIEFRIGHGKWPGNDTHLVLRDSLVAVCSPDTARFLSAPVPAEKLVARPLLHVMGVEDHWARLFGQNGIDRPGNIHDIRVDSSMTAAEHATISNHVALIHRRFAEHYVGHDRLVLASNERVEPEEALYLLRSQRTEQRNPAAILFEKWLREKYSV